MRKFIALVAVVFATPVSAQIFSNSVIMGMGYTAQAGVSQEPVLHSLRQRRAAAAPVPRSSAGSLVGLASAQGSPAGGQAVTLVYRPSVAIQKQVQGEFLARVEQRNPDAAGQLARELAKNDVDRAYAGLLKGTGLRADDLADVLASYTSLGYMIVNGEMSDADPVALRALRNQIAPRLAESPVSGPANRSKVGEELKLLFVTLHAGWQSAQRENNLRAYAEGVARLFGEQGTDLRAVRLTRNGFVGR